MAPLENSAFFIEANDNLKIHFYGQDYSRCDLNVNELFEYRITKDLLPVCSGADSSLRYYNLQYYRSRTT